MGLQYDQGVHEVFSPEPQLSRAIYASAGGYGMDTEGVKVDTDWTPKKEALGL
jgi:hypothetical protein